MHPIKTTFTYPTISYEMGIRHLHMPEHFARSHPLTLPWFRIRNIEQPHMRYRGVNVIVLNCSVLWCFAFRMLLLSDDQSSSCVILSDLRDNARVVLESQVVPYNGYRGHTLSVACVQDLIPKFLLRLYLSAMLWEDRWLWSHETRQLPELVQYRRSVMFSEKT